MPASYPPDPTSAAGTSDAARRQALLAFAAAAHEFRPLPAIDDWGQLLSDAAEHRLIPLAHRLLQHVDCPDGVRGEVRRQAMAMAMQFAIQERQYGRVLAKLESAGVETLVLKGPALARTVYPTPALRPSGDLDVLVHQEDWHGAHEALLSLAYTPIQPLSAPPPKVARHKAYYHTQYVSPDGAHLVEVHYDLWWYGLRPALGEQYWQRSIPLEIGGARTRMASPEDMLLHLCIHLHHHGYDRLVWFTDLALLLRTHGSGLDWAHVVEAARAEGLGIFVYYSLLYLERLLGASAPKWALDTLRPGPLQAWLHDKLCPPQTVLRVEVTDRVAFDFHEVPEATELLLNFFLTGRRREKLAYLGSLLAPSDEWLAYYYATSDPAVLKRRRLTHVPALLLKAFGELGTTLRNGVARQSLA